MKIIFLFLLFVNISFAQEYSVVKQIYIAVSPGGTSDLISRSLGKVMAESQQHPITIINMPGSQATGRSFKDAHKNKQLAAVGISELLVDPILYDKENLYDFKSNFVEFIFLGYSPIVITSRNNIKATNISEFKKYATANTLDLKFSFGGTINGISGIEFLDSIGLMGRKIPYKGGGMSAVNAVLNEDVDFYFGPLSLSKSLIRTGKLTALAINTEYRHLDIPNVATVKEQIGSSYKAQGYFGVAIPNTIDGVTRKLWREKILHAAAAVEFKDAMKNYNIVAMEPITGEKYIRWAEANVAFYKGMIEKHGITR